MELLAQPFSVLIYLGMLLKFSGFFLRDELLLRFLVSAGMAADIIFYALQNPSIWPSVIANAFLVGINAVLITIIIFERTKIGMSVENKTLFESFSTLNPGQFRRVLRRAQRYVLDEDTVLVREGADVGSLYFVQAESFDISKKGDVYPANGPAFVGEVAFLTGAPSSADVRVKAGTEIIALEIPRLRRLMRQNAGLANGMIALFGNDLAKKVANSVPIRG